MGRLNLTTSYEYNANNLVKTTTPKNQTETATYDGNGNVTSVTDEMGTEKFEYNKDNGLIKATDNENRETTVAYKAQIQKYLKQTKRQIHHLSCSMISLEIQLRQLESWEQEKT